MVPSTDAPNVAAILKALRSCDCGALAGDLAFRFNIDVFEAVHVDAAGSRLDVPFTSRQWEPPIDRSDRLDSQRFSQARGQLFHEFLETIDAHLFGAEGVAYCAVRLRTAVPIALSSRACSNCRFS
jgi:hypothetical protein